MCHILCVLQGLSVVYHYSMSMNEMACKHEEVDKDHMTCVQCGADLSMEIMSSLIDQAEALIDPEQ